MKVKIFTLRSQLAYGRNFDESQRVFLHAVSRAADVTFVVNSPDNCEQSDLDVIFVQTGGVEGTFLRMLPNMRQPIYLLTNGQNNSLAAAMEILTYLKDNGIDGEIIHGGAEHAARRISQLCKVNCARRKIADMRLGVIGKPSDWLISLPDYDKVRQLFGTELVDINLEELTDNRRQESRQLPSWDEKEKQKALCLYGGAKFLVDKYRLDGFTLRCFDLLQTDTTGCLALALLNSEKVVACCEGDIMAMLSMAVIRAACGCSSFQANPSRIDPEKNHVVFAHCTLPLDMTESYKFDTHFESGKGVAVKGEMKKGAVTVLRLSADLKHYFLSGGEILYNLDEKDLCRTQIAVRLDEDVNCLLRRPCGNHHVICYGDNVSLLEDVLDSYMLTRVR